MLYIASVIDKSDNKFKIIKDTYSSKKEFAYDLRANGYQVRFITTNDSFDRDCEQYHQQKERKCVIMQAVRRGRRDLEARLGQQGGKTHDVQ